MHIQVFSDLHLEGSDYRIKVDKKTDVVVLAGDIVNGAQVIATSRLENLVKGIKKPVIYVAGNHEFYNQSFQTIQAIRGVIKATKERCPNLFYLENDSVVIDGVRFLGATLWSDFDLADDPIASMARVANAINDFRWTLTEVGEQKRANITAPWNIRDWNRETRLYLRVELSTPFEGKTVVVTHFCPSPKSIHEKYQGDFCNPYFCCNCEDLMELGADLWIHGHTHSSFDYKVGNTRVVCNPKGYGNENSQFNGKCVVEI